MEYYILPQILEQEGTSFYNVDLRWKPSGIVPSTISQKILKNAQHRLNLVSQAESELQTLVRAPMYIRLLKRMRASVRRAQFAWRVDDLELLKAVSDFFGDYGILLQYLKIDQAHGRLEPATM